MILDIMTSQFLITRTPGLIYCLQIHMFCFKFPSFSSSTCGLALPERVTIIDGCDLYGRRNWTSKCVSGFAWDCSQKLRIAIYIKLVNNRQFTIYFRNLDNPQTLGLFPRALVSPISPSSENERDLKRERELCLPPDQTVDSCNIFL